MLQNALELLAASNEIAVDERWYLPFPMGVFGTLRSKQGNNPRMHRGKVGLHKKAFMPHFIATGLSIKFKENASAPFEIFCYELAEWNKMIPGVDALEGFSPEYANRGEYGYYRTLAWLHVLPDEYEHELFTNVNLWEPRDLQIPPDQWSTYQRIPCWVYSSHRENRTAGNADTVIWG